MKADYIKLQNGQKFRVESNWNSFETFCDLTGRSDLSSLDDLKGIRMNEAPILMWACIREGERLDGHDMKLSVEDLKAKINPLLMGEFFQIYTRQTYAQMPEEYQTKKKNLPGLFSRKKNKS